MRTTSLVLILGLMALLFDEGWGQVEGEERTISEVNVSQAQESPAQSLHRISVSAGMGVSYVSAEDIVNLVNSRGLGTEKVADFKAGADFFGALGIPLNSDWSLKLEYSYLLYSYNPTGTLVPAEFTVSAHLPMILVQYTLTDAGTYNVKLGAGAGYHIGYLSEKAGSVEDRYTGKGFGTAVDLEANTAFSDDFFGYLGGNIRWEFIGRLTNDAGRSAYLVANSPEPTLHFFSVGARLGFTFYF